MKRLTRTTLFTALLVITMGCATTQRNPTTDAQQSARTKAATLVGHLDTGLKQVDKASIVVTASAITLEQKNDINCTILKAIGVDAPTAIVTRVCGTLPTVNSSPLKVSVQALHDLTTDAQLSNTIRVVLAAATPIWDKMIASKDTALSALGLILKAAFDPFTFPIGG